MILVETTTVSGAMKAMGNCLGAKATCGEKRDP